MQILMVDDDRGAVEWVVDVLQEVGGHMVTKVETVREAENALEVDQWPYGLLILDVQIRPAGGELMTEEESLIAGLKLYRRFRERHKLARVLILTNNAHRVPTDIWSKDPNTRLEDKVDVAGRKLLDVIRNW